MLKHLKLVYALVAVTFVFLLCSPAYEASSRGVNTMKDVSIVVNDQVVTFQDPILNQSGVILLPMRSFYQSIGANVTWNGEMQTASATRNGKKIELTMNSRRALVNDNFVSMSVAPTIYEGRIYIPLRFVSENLDGTVEWNATTKTVQITLIDSAPGYDKTYVLHMNDRRITMSDPIITSQGKSYIPAEYFTNYIEDTSGKWLSSNQYELVLSWVSFVFTKDQNVITVDGVQKSIAEKPFVYNGKMYVPVNYLITELGGSLRYITEKSEMYIYLYHKMYNSAFLNKTPGVTPLPQLVPTATLSGDRSLLLSDNPEILNKEYVPTPEATLSEQHVQSTKSTNRHRVYGWHYNDFGRTAKVGITIENKSSTESIKIAQSKGVSHKSGNGWVLHESGLYIADAVLNGKLKSAASKDLVIAPGETKIIESFQLFDRYLVGFLHDLDVQSVSGGASNYIIRVVATRSSVDLADIHSDVIPIVQTVSHPRGAWAQSTVVSQFPVYTVGSPEVGFNISNGKTDHLLTKENALSEPMMSTGNVGHFGMNYKVTIPIDNPTGAPATIKIKLAGRGGLYSGALKLNGKVYLVPAIKPGQDYVELTDYPINGPSEKIDLEVMHAGGANLPLGIYVSTK